MLKALELAGFKSFADRTRFEFPPGITVVVGPNGSGKSNIVDAIKWVLGEQSVKSLRGQEMADVIFNGSGERRPMNSAEVTLTLDNSARRLAVDTPEVQITRRVYRGGEGEYLINRNPARLRDIRDLLSGTGMGTQAYSVIEQGKVDVLLQSSARDRRLLFEEAAGISRFRAKKTEALRRLERVEQNLLRLSDIVEEVDGRLRSLRAQAGKARRYRQFAERLQQLRTQVAMVDWRRLSQRVEALEAKCGAWREQRDAAVARVEHLEAQLLEADLVLAELGDEIRRSEAQAALHREHIASAESAVEHERARGRDLEQQIDVQRRQLLRLGARASLLNQQHAEAAEAVDRAEAERGQAAGLYDERRRRLDGLVARLETARGDHQRVQAELTEQLRLAAEHAGRLSALEAELAAREAARMRFDERQSELASQAEALEVERNERRLRYAELEQSAQRRADELAAAESRLAETAGDHALRSGELAELRERAAAARERVAVLDELERRQEGVGAGVKEVLARSRRGDPDALAGVSGLVADLIHVSVDLAPLVEVALGPVAQYVVVAPGTNLRAYAESHAAQWAGRVGFVEPPPAAAEAPPAEVEFDRAAGVVGRLDRLVETPAPFQPLIRRLLGRTWVVERLADAFRLARAATCRADFVTLAGELLSADGTLVVGPPDVAGGLISRRSQLRQLGAELADFGRRVDELGAVVERLERQLAAGRQEVERAADAHRAAIEAVAECRVAMALVEQRREQLAAQRRAAESEAAAAAAERERLERRLAESRRAADELTAAIERARGAVEQSSRRLDELEQQRAAAAEEATRARLELVKSEERLDNQRDRLRRFEQSRRECGEALAETRQQLDQSVARSEQSIRTILRLESEIAEEYLRKERVGAESAGLLARRDQLQGQRQATAGEVQRQRAEIHRIEEQIHRLELEANQVRHERHALAERFREDYGVELAEADNPATDDARQRDEVQEEIDDLRRKINALGNVNLEALDELEQLEARFGRLSGQYQDLVAAKAALEKIIQRIDADSRRLFAATLETVRGHFQTLFRDLFGGGRADLVLEEGVDLLDSGIEIVARPPGKEPRSISLLSGGEKTLTCVALLLAIFRSRPSPFCVLDEVDAALDEANIDRFTQVLQGFLDFTQFIIVTHSKKTMTCADTIYGVTMQESGVSKQVSVRFEDVSDDGQIRPERLHQIDEAQAPSQANDQADGDRTQAA